MSTSQAVKPPKIDVKAAANLAAEYLEAFFLNADKVLLEEVEMTDERDHWYITLSYTPAEDTNSGTGFLTLGRTRKYKQFKINAETGEVMFMKIQEIK